MLFPPMIMWSRSVIPTSPVSFIILSVTDISSFEGCRFPEGWLWISIIFAAFDNILAFNISLGFAIDWLSAPILTSVQLIGVLSLLRLTTHRTSLSISHRYFPSSSTAASGVVILISERMGASFTSLTDTKSSLKSLFITAIILPLQSYDKISFYGIYHLCQFLQFFNFYYNFHNITYIVLSGVS